MEKHYVSLLGRPYFTRLIEYMLSGPVVVMVWEGLDIVKSCVVMKGKSNPADSPPGTIRGDFGVQIKRNVIHTSDSQEEAEKEINLWFKVSKSQERF